MAHHISPEQARRAMALVTDLDLAVAQPRCVRMVAWSTLKILRRRRIEASAFFRHHPGDAA